MEFFVVLVLLAIPIGFVWGIIYLVKLSNKDILNRAIGRPAMMALMILVGTYVTTGQLIPGVF